MSFDPVWPANGVFQTPGVPARLLRVARGYAERVAGTPEVGAPFLPISLEEVQLRPRDARRPPSPTTVAAATPAAAESATLQAGGAASEAHAGWMAPLTAARVRACVRACVQGGGSAGPTQPLRATVARADRTPAATPRDGASASVSFASIARDGARSAASTPRPPSPVTVATPAQMGRRGLDLLRKAHGPRDGAAR